MKYNNSNSYSTLIKLAEKLKPASAVGDQNWSLTYLENFMQDMPEEFRCAVKNEL